MPLKSKFGLFEVGAVLALAAIIFASGGFATVVVGNTERLDKMEIAVDLLTVNQTRLITILEEQRR